MSSKYWSCHYRRQPGIKSLNWIYFDISLRLIVWMCFWRQIRYKLDSVGQTLSTFVWFLILVAWMPSTVASTQTEIFIFPIGKITNQSGKGSNKFSNITLMVILVIVRAVKMTVGLDFVVKLYYRLVRITTCELTRMTKTKQWSWMFMVIKKVTSWWRKA